MIVASIFRNAEHYVDRYFDQIEALHGHLGVRLVIAEGDSTDDTYQMLSDRVEGDDVLLKVDHGGPSYGSIDHPDRWKQIAMVCNEVMDVVRATVGADEPVWYVESDLIWDTDVPLTLLHDLEGCEAVAPLSMRHGVFYDIWGYRGTDDERFTADPPFHPSIAAGLTKIHSAGSAIMMRPEVARAARFDPKDCIVGFCRSIRENGANLWLDQRVAVQHP